MIRNQLVPVSMLALFGAAVALSATAVEAKPPSTVPGGEPYQTTIYVSVPAGSNAANAFSEDPVPADRRLVIEFVSVRSFVPSGQVAIFWLSGQVGGFSRNFAIPPVLVKSWPLSDEFQVGTMVRLYHDGDGVNGPGAFCGRDVTQGTASCEVTISGYLIGK